MKSKAIKWLSAQVQPTTTKAELDVIDFLKKLVRDYKVPEKNTEKEQYIDELFAKFYKVYIRKGAREQALKTFRKKLIKLKTKDEILDKARKIAKLYVVSANEWRERETEKQFIPLCSSWLNANVPD